MLPGPLVYVLFFLSGATGLVYELVWVRELIFVFGGTTYAITTVLVAFMAGLGLGSYGVGRWCHRLTRPGRVYGGLEIAIGLYALLVPLLLRVAEPAYRSLYPHVADQAWLLTMFRFCLSAPIVLLPATCMGATLPVLVRHVTLRGGALGRSVGTLYGINTLGAVVGTLAAGFWLLPGLGLTRTTWVAASVNVLIGLVAVARLGAPLPAVRVARAPHGRKAAAAPPIVPLPMSAAGRAALLVGFAISGFAAMVYQITWTRALVLSLGSSTYSFTCILAAFILGLGLGSLCLARWVDRWRNPLLVFGVLELVIGLVAVLIVPIHGRVPLLAQSIVMAYGNNFDTLLRLELLLVIAVTIVPTFLLGVIFPLVIRALAGQREDGGAATGRAYAVNTAGTIAGSFLGGFVLIRSDVLGVQNSILLASALNGAVGAILVWLSPRPAGTTAGRRSLAAGAALALIVLVSWGVGRWDPLLLSTAPYLKRGSVRDILGGQQLKYFAEGVDLTVAVMRHESGTLTLTVNGKPDASTGADMAAQLLLGHVPALVGPAGRSACIIGLGSGITLSAVGRYPSYERLDCIEISDEVIRAGPFFAPYTYRVLTEDPRVRLIRADGRNHLLLTDQMYDLIVSEPSNPWLSGVANLFTREFFELCRARLRENGVLGVWLQSYTMSVRDFQMVIRTLLESFGHVSLWQLHESDCMLVASRHPLRVDPAELQRRFETPAVWADLYRIGLYRPAHILGRYVTSDAALRGWVEAAPVHTDDNALLEFSAPRHLYEDEGPEISNALARLQRPPLSDLLAPEGGPAPSDLEREVANVVRGRVAPAAARAAHQRREPIQILRELIDAYRGDMSNAALYSVLQEFMAGAPPGRTDVDGLRAEFARLRGPVTARLEGTTLAEMAVLRRKLAEEGLQRGETDVVIEDLREAVRLEPTHLRTRLALASVLAHSGRDAEAAALVEDAARTHPDEGLLLYVRAMLAARAGDREGGLALLERAVGAGAVSGQQLGQDELFGSWRGDSRFEALLAVPATRPASAPAP